MVVLYGDDADAANAGQVNCSVGARGQGDIVGFIQLKLCSQDEDCDEVAVAKESTPVVNAKEQIELLRVA